MPNKRKDGKKKVGLWIDKNQLAELEALARLHHLNVSDLIKLVIHQVAEESGINQDADQDKDENVH